MELAINHSDIAFTPTQQMELLAAIPTFALK
jgi:hypothetical protein